MKQNWERVVSVKYEQIEKAAERLSGVVHQIPLSGSTTFSQLSGSELYLKLENQQKTGSFKVRGAYNKIATLVEKGEKPKSVVASSAGNHAQGVAFAANALGIPATIVMPKSAPLAKVSATEEYGATVVLAGDCYDDAYKFARELCEKEGAVFIHPFDDEDVIAGQGTIALEILRDNPTIDVVLVPAGGGGLLAGVAFAMKHINPRVKVVGVQAEGANAIVRTFKEKKQIKLSRVETIADGIAVKEPGTLTTEMINKYVDDMVTVSDSDIAATILLLLERSKLVVEPAGAASLAVALNGHGKMLKNKKVACILSGGNIDVSFIHRIVEKGLANRGRQVRFSTVMLDIPGSLEHFSRIVARCGANIIRIQHDRMDANIRLDEAILHVTCEVGGWEHSAELIRTLEEEGYVITKQ